MDEASRLKRAEDMGFDMDLELAHGTSVPIKGVDDWTTLEPSLAGDYGRGVYLSNPAFAEQYTRSAIGSPRLYPARVRSKKLLDQWQWQKLKDKAVDMTVDAKAWDDDVFEIARDLAEEAGYEGVYRGILGSDSSWGSAPVVNIFDPKNIRSPWAAFDPSKIESRDLLAGIGGLTGARYMSNALREDREN